MEKSKRREEFLPFCRPTIEEDEIKEVADSLKTGWITTGPKVAVLEKKFRDWSGGQEAIAVNSATAGLHLALVTLDLAPGDEVITTPITWPSTVNNIEICGARTVFADVDRETLQILPGAIESVITRRTRAVIPVHFAGAPCDLDAIREICRKHGLSLIEDAAHAVGTRYKKKLIGSDSELAVFSFHPIKNMTTGEGGMILCSDRERSRRMRRLGFHGISRDAGQRYAKTGTPQYDVIEPGYKYNMLDLEAAIGIHQFHKLNSFNKRRKRLAERYFKLLGEVPEIIPLMPPAYAHLHAWHLFVVRLDISVLEIDRDEFMLRLQKENVGTGLHFPAVHLQKYYREKYELRRGMFPGAEWNSDRLFSLPLYPLLREEDQDYVVEALKSIITRYRKKGTAR